MANNKISKMISHLKFPKLLILLSWLGIIALLVMTFTNYTIPYNISWIPTLSLLILALIGTILTLFNKSEQKSRKLYILTWGFSSIIFWLILLLNYWQNYPYIM